MASQSADAKATTGSGQRIEKFHDDARQFQRADFEDRHGSGFLLLIETGIKFDGENTSTEMVLLDDPEDAAERTTGVGVLVFPIRPANRSHTHLITVGRASVHDVTIPDISVSRFHAYCKRRSDGGYQVVDAGSSNGTTVNGLSVPIRGAGAPVGLKSGDRVRFGKLEFSFLDAEALQEFVLQYGK